MENIYYIYIMRCSGDRLYTGYTSDPVKRFNEHKTGKGGAKFTKAFRPVLFEVLWEITGTRGDAMRVEAFIKSLKKIDKIMLIENPLILKRLVADPYPEIEVNISDIKLLI